MVTPQEIELLAQILQRAGVTVIEAIWVNNLMNRLRAMVGPQLEPPESKANEK